MIARLTGALVDREGNRGVLDVRGVGYEVFAPAATLERWAAAREDVVAHVHTHVAEEVFALYAFESDVARRAFGVLLGVSGIGPKVALAALDGLSPGDLAQAVEAGDVATLSRVKGVGKKTAQRMVIDLKGKLPAEFPVRSAAGGAAPPPDDALPLALQRLGYSRAEIARATEALQARGVGPDQPIAARLRAALAALSGSAS